MAIEIDLIEDTFDMAEFINDSETGFLDDDDDLLDPLEEEDEEDEDDWDEDEFVNSSPPYDFPEEDPSRFEYVKQTIDQEGMHYAFENYSNFEEIKDEEFHKLRKTYLETAKALEDYIEAKIKHG
jgi:hypothetical protein